MPRAKKTTRKKTTRKKATKTNVVGNWRGIEDSFFNKVRKGFIKLFKEKLELVGLDEDFSKRSVNDGFSGGEKKRFEILQMLLLNPKFILLDETDSGLDIDALKTVAHGINAFRNSNRSIILITHYQRILDYLEPDKIHILMDGSIVKTGDIDLVNILEDKGYKWIKKDSN